jgi:hypothetical protein
MAAKVEWVRGWRGTKIVTLPDESELTSMMLAKELKLTKHTAIARINAYIDNGSLVDLWRAKNKKMDSNNRAKKEVAESFENLDTHYENGDLKHYYDPDWKFLMQNI